MKNLCIGIIELTAGWKVILDQLGVWYKVVNFDNELASSYSVIIVNESLSIENEELLQKFNDAGGSILETASGDLFSHARFTTKMKVKRILNTGNIPFLNHIPFLDIYGDAELYNSQDNFDGLIDFERHEKGIVCNLGIEPGRLISDNSYTRKRFKFKKEMHPDELVSNVSKGTLVDLVSCLLKELHFQQQLPFVCKWISPKEKPVFAFRIDSDFGNQESINALKDIGEEYEIPMSWFLHVGAHEDWLNLFKEFKNQEIALHGFDHVTSTSYEQTFDNIEKGLHLLKDVGINPNGFCAPYAIWNDSLAEVLTKFEFEYTSEFTVGYDSNPFFPIHNDKEMRSLQVPIHPICTGSLNRKKVSFEEMKEYFLDTLSKKLSRFEPVIFYHHPLQPGTEVWNDVFNKVNELNLTKLSFSEFSNFWKKRLEANIEASINQETKELVFNNSSNGLLIQVSHNQSSFELIQISNDQEFISSGEFEYTSTSLPNKEEIEELSAGKMQLLKTSILDWKNRRRV